MSAERSWHDFFVELRNFFRTNAPKFSRNFQAFILWAQTNRTKFPPDIPQDFPAKIQEILIDELLHGAGR